MSKRNLLAIFLILGFAVSLFNIHINLSADDNKVWISPPAETIASPVRITLIPNGKLLVTDPQARKVYLVDSENREIQKSLAINGRPMGIAFHKDYVYVGNETAAAVEIYEATRRGDYRKAKTIPNILLPTDIEIDGPRRRVFVVDSKAKKVKIFTPKGHPIFEFPSGGDPALQFPTGIALDRVNQKVFVSDYGDMTQDIYASINIYDYAGKLLSTISGKGSGMLATTKFSRPQGIASDNSGNIFVVDCYSSEIMVFDVATGSLLKTIGGFGSEPGKMMLPLDIALNNTTMDIFVTNNRASRIEIFREGGRL